MGNGLEDNVLGISLRLCPRLLQHLVAEYRRRNADIQTVDSDLVGLAAMGDSDLVSRQVDQTGLQSSALSTHHEDCGVLGNWAVVGGKTFPTLRNSVNYFVGSRLGCVFG